ncbi:MAG TPA: hypothetical protein PLH11_02340 [Gemmobacter sp.]|nr:hypothetical protein [Gemmobacter sp.]
MNVLIRMPIAVSQASSPAAELAAMFASMRPSARRKLSEVAVENPAEFLSGLDTFLRIWAESDWVEVYKVERTGRWVAKLCPPDMLPSIRKMIEGKAPANQTDAMSVPSQTYAAFLAGLTAP